ncbi:MAG TPA: WcaI family glycosyltransferase [Candidatus Limnocylindria bacterium]|nr:WcaI family glycosyltransferase [Candidatus Limnocylindria bacterium]
MKINVWGINYAPEMTGIAPCNTALCEHLHTHGHDVRMVTSFAYYPSWLKATEDRGRAFRTDEVRGVRVHRCWHYVPRRANALKRIVHEATFVATSFFRQLTLPAPDAYVVVSPPLLLGAAAWLLGAIKRRSFVFHVQDLQPDAAAGLGMLKPGLLMRALYRLESIAYRKAARVSGITPGMIDAFRRKNVPDSKLVLFPNGVVLPDLSKAPAPGAFRQRNSFSTEDFLAVYSGNLGVKQGLGILIDAARHITDPRVRIVICGEGAQRDELAGLMQSQGLRNVTLLPLQSEDHYREMLVDADVGVITQQRGSGGFFFPSKLLTILAWAKPVLAVADENSELVHALREGRFGLHVEPGEPQKLAQALERLSANRRLLKDHAVAGRSYVAQFEMDRVLQEFVSQLESLITLRGESRTSSSKLQKAPAWTVP